MSCSVLFLALSEGTPRVKAPAIMDELRSEWKTMSLEKKTEVTQGAMLKLEEVQEMKIYGTHNMSISLFHDMRSMPTIVQTQVRISVV
jgi:hypothetical protein